MAKYTDCGESTLGELSYTDALVGMVTGPVKVITNLTKVAADREILTHSESVGAVAGCTLLGLGIGSRMARANVKKGKKPFLGFIG